MRLQLALLFQNRSVSGRQTGDRHTERRAGNVVQANLVAEHDGRRIAAVLAADAEFDVRAGLLAELNGHLNELADAVLVKTSERIRFVDLLVVVRAEELAGVVAGEAEGHLGQIAGSRSWCRP